NLTDRGIPQRTRITELIVEAFQREYKAMVREIQNSLGRTSYIGDVWSCNNLESYFAITRHYM
ncbi:hypothetical protein GALMADRAFT_35969, partial [Galerina marginata CBS 339.88]